MHTKRSANKQTNKKAILRQLNPFICASTLVISPVNLDGTVDQGSAAFPGLKLGFLPQKNFYTAEILFKEKMCFPLTKLDLDNWFSV